MTKALNYLLTGLIALAAITAGRDAAAGSRQYDCVIEPDMVTEIGSPISGIIGEVLVDRDLSGLELAVLSAWLIDRRPDEQPSVVRLIARRPWLSWLLAGVSFVAVCTCFGIPHRPGETYDATKQLAEHVLYGLTALFFVIPAVFGDRAGGWPRRP